MSTLREDNETYDNNIHTNIQDHFSGGKFDQSNYAALKYAGVQTDVPEY